MPLIFQHRIYRVDLVRNRSLLYVFGDNMAETGKGGQAAEMRGEPNAVGLPTKRRPARDPSAYFSDLDLDAVRRVALARLRRLHLHLKEGGIVVWPLDGIGSGRAELLERAPQIHAFYERALKALHG